MSEELSHFQGTFAAVRLIGEEGVIQKKDICLWCNLVYFQNAFL